MQLNSRDVLLEKFGESFEPTEKGYRSAQTSNQIMKFLAIAATIFAPLTFLTGIWGMNFKYMPELNWRLGYPVALGLMGIVIIIMLIFFKKKKWI